MSFSTTQPEMTRRMPVGAESHAGGGVHFRVWAPSSPSVSVVFSKDAGMNDVQRAALKAEAGGYHAGFVEAAGVGDYYRYEVKTGAFPDPASRYQPEGPHGPSQVVDPTRFTWTDGGWGGLARQGQVIYEMHVGTFTAEGTWRAAAAEVAALADLGVTVLEIMPVADFPGRFGWGYDGVNLFAPTRLYGEPDDFRGFVDQAHAAGLGVILDVVYNHLGPDGNYLRQFSDAYFTDRYVNEWGDAINFDDEACGPVRELFVANVEYWIREFHLDGLRLDATQQMFDASAEHVLAEMARQARRAAGSRKIYLVAENEPQQARLVRDPERGGYGLDAIWNDDFHHSAIVALTRRNEAYYTDHQGKPQEFISACKHGFLYQGQRYRWQKNRRGSAALDLSPEQFVVFLENHDQVANSLWGKRVHQTTDPGRYRALAALLLLGPGTPLLFQGQEFNSSRPFQYFGEHNPELAKLIAAGRAKFLSQFPSIASAGAEFLPSPEKESTFLKSKLKLCEREEHAEAYAMHRDLLGLRRRDPVIGKVGRRDIDGAVLGEEAFLLRYFNAEHGDRLLLVNLGPGLDLAPGPEPLLAPCEDASWTLRWSSEEPKYGGGGTPQIETADGGWYLPAHSAVLMVCQNCKKADHEPDSKD
ncbi:MAG TPA: malto-oligosyltrehalose trehalohydrolase [Prosthecobacter sp.]|nr:malto-oligosyltrehalose trehalohydrolase [Prosthecobacter sp.]